MGVVFQARDEQTGELVAMKILTHASTEGHERMIREATVMRRIAHPNVLGIRQVGSTDGGIPFLVMDLLTGWTSQDWLDSRGALSESLAMPILRDLFVGVAAIRDAGVLHRDLKPSNVFVCARSGSFGRAVVFDFGVSETTRNHYRITKGNEVPGTPIYLAPEIIRGAPFDHEADFYASALTAYTILNGENPFVRTSWPQSSEAILYGPRPSIPHISKDLDEVLRAAIEIERGNRSTISDVFRVLGVKQDTSFPRARTRKTRCLRETQNTRASTLSLTGNAAREATQTPESHETGSRR